MMAMHPSTPPRHSSAPWSHDGDVAALGLMQDNSSEAAVDFRPPKFLDTSHRNASTGGLNSRCHPTNLKHMFWKNFRPALVRSRQSKHSRSIVQSSSRSAPRGTPGSVDSLDRSKLLTAALGEPCFTSFAALHVPCIHTTRAWRAS